MIGKLTGTLLEKNPPEVLLDCHGVGYEVNVPMSTFYNLPAVAVQQHLGWVFFQQGAGQFAYHGCPLPAHAPVAAPSFLPCFP